MSGFGSILTFQKRDPVPDPGPPFDLGSADNGLSVDPVSRRIVLGQDVGAVGNPAQLLSFREIPCPGGLGIALTDTTDPSGPTTGILPGDILIQRDTTSPNQIDVQLLNSGPTPGQLVMSLDTETSQRFEFEYNSTGQTAVYFNNDGRLELFSSIAMNQGPGIFIGSPNGDAPAITRLIFQAIGGANSALVDSTGTLFSNGDIGANVDILLPPWAQGAFYMFVVEANAQLRVTADGTDIIRILSGVSSAGGTADSANIGDFLTLHAVTAGIWVATSVGGTWVLA